MNKSVMWDYIAQEPEVLTGLLADQSISEYAERIAPELEAVYFVAHGSSYNATIAVADFFASQTGLRVYAYTPANFLYKTSLLRAEHPLKTLIIAVSQTGTSSGVLTALRKARELGLCTLGITGINEAPIKQFAEDVLMLRCGLEDSNAKTKGYSATLTLLILLAVAFGRARRKITENQAAIFCGELQGQIDTILATKERLIQFCEENHFGESLTELYILGYGMNYGTAMEGQLKIMETMCIPTMFNDIGEFSHGMHRAITKESTVLLIKTVYPLAELMEQTWYYLQGITPHVLMLDASGSCKDEPGRIMIPAYENTASLLLTTLAVQVFSVFAPERIGLDPNRDSHNDLVNLVGTRV